MEREKDTRRESVVKTWLEESEGKKGRGERRRKFTGEKEQEKKAGGEVCVRV